MSNQAPNPFAIIHKLSALILESIQDLGGGDKDGLAEYVAQLFCEMSDDGQAQFFVHVAKIMNGWESTMQPWYIGRHLAECDCSTQDARAWVTELAEHIKEYMKSKNEVEPR